MGNEVSGLVPNDEQRNSRQPAQPAWLGTSMNNISFGGNADAMRSFDERGGGRRVAANLADDAFGSFEDDKHDADDLGGDTHDWGGNDTQKQAAPTNEAAVNKQQANRGGDADFDEEPPKKYKWKEIPEVTLPMENDSLLRRAAPGTGLQRKTRKIVEQFTTKEEVFDLQGQEQQRALDLQRRAIEKVLIAKHSHLTKKGKEEIRLQAAISEAKTTALAVSEYATYSSNMFLGYDEWMRRQKGGH